jgi:antitoxin (DNA-binding transcriptional repressor) of toxin-antitoxin stability system
MYHGLLDGGSRVRVDVAATVASMTLPSRAYEVGVRDLHDRLSEHLERVEGGAEIVVTRRGRSIAKLSRIDREHPLDELIRRGLVTPPATPREPRRARVESRGPVSEFVTEQRR